MYANADSTASGWLCPASSQCCSCTDGMLPSPMTRSASACGAYQIGMLITSTSSSAIP